MSRPTYTVVEPTRTRVVMPRDLLGNVDEAVVRQLAERMDRRTEGLMAELMGFAEPRRVKPVKSRVVGPRGLPAPAISTQA